MDAVLAAQQERIAAIAKAKAASVSVFANGGRGGGSGVVITADGYALTNFHVSKPAGNHMKCSMPDGVLYDAVIVGIDPTGDVAMIKLLGRDDFPHAELGDSDLVRPGDWCFAVGNPFLLATNFEPTVTYGIVSGVNRYQYPAGTLLEYADCIQTDASINPGNSGGPLFNAQAQLIGINGRGSFEKRGRVNVGVGYAISINQIKNFMGYLRSGRIVDHATLGASVATSEEGLVLVSNIIETSDAYRRGLRYDDEIVAFGGRPITTVNGFKNVLGIYPKGWRVPLSFRRDGKRYDVLVRLSGVHSDDELISKIQPGLTPSEKDAPDPGHDPEGPAPGPDKPGPRPIPLQPGKAPAPPPKEAAPFIEMRRGYANYYFNQLNRDRVWTAFEQGGSFTGQGGVWTAQGELEAGGAFELTLGETAVSGVFPAGPASIDPSKDLDTQLAPEGSGGLLAAMHLWRRLLLNGPEKFGQVYYLGTAPMAGFEQPIDVLVATHGVIESKFMFDPQTGRLVGMEMYADSYADPCELYFSEYREVDGRQLPGRIEVRRGDDVFGVLLPKTYDLAKTPKTDA
ncbi:Periplasmic serine endoprotease DegP precursor [Lignipirellula cremea]|uniref:Periplasmic serine endoprotease DegP n=2 Tax=Lignipirellula cremea TaxID=2528010 RepID=A0A518DMU7_9BACT|nr:Periplasmic serine endoprotease DegP precursor [Lignipirellula cremea]